MEAKERLAIYKKALEIGKEQLSTNISCRVGLCSWISDAIVSIYGYAYHEDEDKDPYVFLNKKADVLGNPYPEIIKYRPKLWYNGYNWFPMHTEGIKKRLSILEEAVAELEKI